MRLLVILQTSVFWGSSIEDVCKLFFVYRKNNYRSGFRPF